MQAAEAGAGASLGSRAPLLVCRVGVVYKLPRPRPGLAWGRGEGRETEIEAPAHAHKLVLDQVEHGDCTGEARFGTGLVLGRQIQCI